MFSHYESPDARAHKKCRHPDYEAACEPLSRLHYVRVESLECIAVDNDRMIRGFLEDGDLYEPAGCFLRKITNCLFQGGEPHIKADVSCGPAT